MVYGLDVSLEWGFDPKVDWDGKGGPPPVIPALARADDGGVGGGRSGGMPVDGTNFPKWVKWSDPNGNPIPDFDQTPMLNVSDKARQVIESLEPGVHQFFPVEYQNHKGQDIGTRYWFVICNRIDSVDREHTTFVLHKGLEWRSAKHLVRRREAVPDHIDPTAPARMVFNLKAIGEKHLWVDKHLAGQRYISDGAAEAFAAAGLTGIRPSKNESI